MKLVTIAQRFAKFSKKGSYIKVRVPDDVRRTLDDQSPLGRECLEAHLLSSMAGAMHGIARHDIADPTERSRIIRANSPSFAAHS